MKIKRDDVNQFIIDMKRIFTNLNYRGLIYIPFDNTVEVENKEEELVQLHQFVMPDRAASYVPKYETVNENIEDGLLFRFIGSLSEISVVKIKYTSPKEKPINLNLKEFLDYKGIDLKENSKYSFYSIDESFIIGELLV